MNNSKSLKVNTDKTGLLDRSAGVYDTDTSVTPSCFYQGYLEGRNGSSAAVSTCYGLDGVVTDKDGQEFLIQPLQGLLCVLLKYKDFVLMKISFKKFKLQTFANIFNRYQT